MGTGDFCRSKKWGSRRLWAEGRVDHRDRDRAGGSGTGRVNIPLSGGGEVELITGTETEQAGRGQAGSIPGNQTGKRWRE